MSLTVVLKWGSNLLTSLDWPITRVFLLVVWAPATRAKQSLRGGHAAQQSGGACQESAAGDPPVLQHAGESVDGEALRSFIPICHHRFPLFLSGQVPVRHRHPRMLPVVRSAD